MLKKKTKLITTEQSKTNFVAPFLEEFLDFKGHAERVKNQYREAKHLKENLPASHIFVQMDFAED